MTAAYVESSDAWFFCPIKIGPRLPLLRSQDRTIFCRRHADDTAKQFCEVTLVREACSDCSLENANAWIVEKPPPAINSPAQHVLVRRYPDRLFEQFRKIVWSHPSCLSQSCERDVLVQMLFNEFKHTLIRVRNNTRLELRIPPGKPFQRRQTLLYRWYREMLREQIPALISKWEQIMGIRVDEWGIKRMKTRWGTCNFRTRRIWLNLELAKKAPSCLEYIIVHEMVHLLERHHNDRFTGYMDRFMPGWRTRREELNRAPLSHEDWTY